jgi:hypothetical protein
MLVYLEIFKIRDEIGKIEKLNLEIFFETNTTTVSALNI